MVEKKGATKGRGKVVFVTGAHGALGGDLVRALIKEGNTVRGLIQSAGHTVRLPPCTIPVVGNVEDAHVLDSACKGADVVYHLAAIVREEKRRIGELMRVNVYGTRNVIEACRKNGVKQLIFTSTSDIYGPRRSELLKETSQPMPRDKYGYSKMLAEQDIAASGVPYTTLRISTIYGPSFRSSFFKLFRAIHEGKIVIIGSGQNHMALIHTDDVVRALLLAKDNRASINKTYNLSDGVPYTQEQLMDLASRLLGAPKPTRHVSELIVRVLARQRRLESDELRFMTSNRVLDVSKIRDELGFVPKVKMEAGMAEMVDMFIEEGERRERKVYA